MEEPYTVNEAIGSRCLGNVESPGGSGSPFLPLQRHIDALSLPSLPDLPRLQEVEEETIIFANRVDSVAG
jgi:hypothetical protein